MPTLAQVLTCRAAALPAALEAHVLDAYSADSETLSRAVAIARIIGNVRAVQKREMGGHNLLAAAMASGKTADEFTAFLVPHVDTQYRLPPGKVEALAQMLAP
jgi:hypothetical protein